MNYGYTKRFKEYGEDIYSQDTELTRLYYRDGWSGVDVIAVEDARIVKITPKKLVIECLGSRVMSGENIFKESVGAIKGNSFYVLKEDTEEAINFMLRSYKEKYEKDIEELEKRLERVRNAQITHLEVVR